VQTDWTHAFDNNAYIPNLDQIAADWNAQAAALRLKLFSENRAKIDVSYGPDDRQCFDLFLPKGTPKGLVLFVHGGYWQAFDKATFSHFSQGPLDHGWAVAVPSYRLTPQVTMTEIGLDVASAVNAAASFVDGPIRLTGSSAGGHLVARMACQDSHLAEETAHRLEKVLSISGLHDLRPIRFAKMNTVLQMSELEAASESPALLEPRVVLPISFWVGAGERPELIRQTRLIAEIWGAKSHLVQDFYEPNQDHFTVVCGLQDASSPLVQELLA
jgi:arylformamidase